MRDQDIALFFTCGVVICIVMAVVNLLRFKSRGISAYFLAGAFAALGFLFMSMLQKWPDSIATIFAVIIAACLVVDFILRSGKGNQTP
ncbi:MAG TPA: hypothetical protein VGL56_11350 [Fimbriimonadaceae bacterium]|jgi:hypothetical protein